MMFLHIDGIEVPKHLMYHVCFNDGRKLFYNMPENLIPLGETEWPETVKGMIEEIFRQIGIEQPLRQKLVEPYACAFGGIKGSSGECKLGKVNWDQLVDYFRWEAQTISSREANDEFEIRAGELQEQALVKYGSKFVRYIVYADPDHVKTDVRQP
ncbi:MAG: hypothetical protein JW944_02085 [Deltaproteobacteria bacterium]|nr:hypothetical protein [Deltaproteobacteria bacterium]